MVTRATASHSDDCFKKKRSSFTKCQNTSEPDVCVWQINPWTEMIRSDLQLELCVRGISNLNPAISFVIQKHLCCCYLASSIFQCSLFSVCLPFPLLSPSSYFLYKTNDKKNKILLWLRVCRLCVHLLLSGCRVSRQSFSTSCFDFLNFIF